MLAQMAICMVLMAANSPTLDPMAKDLILTAHMLVPMVTCTAPMAGGCQDQEACQVAGRLLDQAQMDQGGTLQITTAFMEAARAPLSEVPTTLHTLTVPTKGQDMVPMASPCQTMEPVHERAPPLATTTGTWASDWTTTEGPSSPTTRMATSFPRTTRSWEVDEMETASTIPMEHADPPLDRGRDQTRAMACRATTTDHTARGADP